MHHAATQRAALPGRADPSGLIDAIEALRPHLHEHDERAALGAALDGVVKLAKRIVTEHAGMAEEVLGTYEQLGVVFAVTRNLPGMRNEDECIALFLTKLQECFAHRSVSSAHLSDTGKWRVSGAPLLMEERLAELVGRSREQAAVLVEPAPPDLRPFGIAEVMVGPVFSRSKFVCAVVITRPEHVSEFGSGEMLLLESLTGFCGDVIANHRLVRELREVSIALVRALVNAVDQKDEYTSGHSVRVAYYATMLAREVRMAPEDLQMLTWSALLHDIGKIGIRDDVLKKTGKLTDEEFAHMKEHPVRSHVVLQEVPQLAKAMDGVLHHHERFDGTGYPSGLAGDRIPLQARIVQVADIFDALTSNRSYRGANNWRKALEILEQESGRTVDPDLFDTFARLIRERLDGSPGAWEKMVATADQFARTCAEDAAIIDEGA